MENTFEVYMAVKLPIPFPDKRAESELSYDLMARYELEVHGFLIDKERTKYALLNTNELGQYSRELVLIYCGGVPAQYC